MRTPQPLLLFVLHIIAQALVNHGLHESYADLVSKSPLQNRALTLRLAQALSQLAHWCPVFGEWKQILNDD